LGWERRLWRCLRRLGLGLWRDKWLLRYRLLIRLILGWLGRGRRAVRLAGGYRRLLHELRLLLGLILTLRGGSRLEARLR